MPANGMSIEENSCSLNSRWLGNNLECKKLDYPKPRLPHTPTGRNHLVFVIDSYGWKFC
jgi:hypothetical protein